MKALLSRGYGFAEAVVDRANPLLVRHVRQELRNRGFIGVFIVMLLAAVLASLFMAGQVGGGREGEAGRWLFGLLGIALSFALMVAQPIGAFRAMTRERDEDTWDLIDLTGMRPGAILRGILMATLVQGALYTAAIAPFMLMAYLLRGLDILTVALITLSIVMAGIASTAFAIFWACLGSTKATRGVLSVILVLLAMLGWFVSWFPIMGLAQGELARVFSREPAEAWTAFAMMVNAWAANVAVLLVLSATMLTFRAGNRSTVPRLTWYAVALNACLWAVGLTIGFDQGWGEMLIGLGFALALWSLPLGFFACTEDWDLSPRQARWFHAGGLRPLVGWFLGPGAARGRFAYLVLAVPAAAMMWLGVAIEGRDEEVAWVGMALMGHLALYLAVSDGLARTLLRRVIDTPLARRMLVLVLCGGISIAQLMVNLVVRGGFLPLNVLSPGWCAVFLGDGIPGVSGVMSNLHYVVLVLVLASGIALLVVQALFHLRVHTVRVVARADDSNPRGG